MSDESSEQETPPVVARMSRRLTSWGIEGACYLGLAALLVMFVGTVYPKPLFVIASMSIGQVLGGLAALIYLAAVLNDLRR